MRPERYVPIYFLLKLNYIFYYKGFNKNILLPYMNHPNLKNKNIFFCKHKYNNHCFHYIRIHYLFYSLYKIGLKHIKAPYA